ncbi:MAG TPA: ATP-dependent Clp protease proteolytic subunit, partial [Archangium sp.]
MLGTPINDAVADRVVAQLLALDQDPDPSKGITLYLNSPGGSVTASLAICYTLKNVRHPVSTVCIHQCQGAAALVLACGTPGQRFCLSEGSISLLPLTGGRIREGGPTTPKEVERESQQLSEACAELLSERTGRSREQARHDLTQGIELDAAGA